MKTSSLKNATLLLLTSLTVIGAAQAKEPTLVLGANKQQLAVTPSMAGAVLQMPATCPAPYTKYTNGMDESKGEYECVKSAATCPDAYDSHRNDANGELTCTLKQIPPAPTGWAPGAGGGNLVYTSIPQPMVNCPKATPTWQWGTTYWKESWNRMGCRANLKPAY